MGGGSRRKLLLALSSLVAIFTFGYASRSYRWLLDGSEEANGPVSGAPGDIEWRPQFSMDMDETPTGIDFIHLDGPPVEAGTLIVESPSHTMDAADPEADVSPNDSVRVWLNQVGGSSIDAGTSFELLYDDPDSEERETLATIELDNESLGAPSDEFDVFEFPVQ